MRIAGKIQRVIMLGYFKHLQEWTDFRPLDQLNLTRHPTISVLVRFVL